MPSKPAERRSGKQSKPEDLPTVFEHKASKPMSKMDHVVCRIAAFVLFSLVVGTFVRAHFMGPPHTPSEEHKMMQMVLEWAPLLLVSGLSISLFVRPAAMVRMFLTGGHKAIEVAPGLISQLRFFRKDRRNNAT